MIYQFEHEEINACGDCPCCDSIGGCALGGSVDSLDKVPDDCPLVAISKTETVGCDDLYSQCGECGQIYLENRGYDYCPNCGRRLED